MWVLTALGVDMAKKGSTLGDFLLASAMAPVHQLNTMLSNESKCFFCNKGQIQSHKYEPLTKTWHHSRSRNLKS